MSVKTDVERLEKAAGDPGMCDCGPPRIVYENEWRDNAPDPGPEVCPECGRPRLTFVVAYEHDWRGGEL